jgi:hypothetical protein
MRGTVVWLVLFVCCLSACEETADAPLVCQPTKACGDVDGSTDFCCLAFGDPEKPECQADAGSEVDAGHAADTGHHADVHPECHADEKSGASDVQTTCLATLKEAVPHMDWEGLEPLAKDDRVIIASLPSPFRTGTASLFDPALEGLIAALSDNNFVRDRSWLWEVAEKDGAAGDSGSKKAKVDKIDCSGVLPGVMLFQREEISDALHQGEKERSKGSSDQPLAAASRIVVFIVGESPVWGLDEPAINWAVSRARARGRLNIMGPYFSGSATSMHRALVNASVREGCVQMASGTMTVIEQAMKLERFQPVFAVDTRAARRAVLANFVRERPKSNSDLRVALFREDATAFGSYSVTEGNWLDFPISPSVSRVRRAHAELQRKRAMEAGIKAAPYLDATLDHDPSAPDLLPTTSRNTVIAEDLKFDGIVQFLRRHRISNVGIHLHAAEDVIFATQHLRQAMPEVRPLLMTMDRTFLHPQYAATMDGALVASAYLDLMIDTRAQDGKSKDAVQHPDGQATAMSAATDGSTVGANAAASSAGASGKKSKKHKPTAALRVFSRDSSPGVYRATQWLFNHPAEYRSQISTMQRTSQLGVIRRGKIWPLTPVPHNDSLTPTPIPIEFVGAVLLVVCLLLAWPYVMRSAAAFLDLKEPVGLELNLSRLSFVSIASCSVALFTAWMAHSYGAPRILMNRVLAVLSGVSPLAEILLCLSSLGVFLAMLSLLEIHSLSALGNAVALGALCVSDG